MAASTRVTGSCGGQSLAEFRMGRAGENRKKKNLEVCVYFLPQSVIYDELCEWTYTVCRECSKRWGEKKIWILQWILTLMFRNVWIVNCWNWKLALHSFVKNQIFQLGPVIGALLQGLACAVCCLSNPWGRWHNFCCFSALRSNTRIYNETIWSESVNCTNNIVLKPLTGIVCI